MTFIILHIILGMVVAEKEDGIINPIKAMRQIKSRERENIESNLSLVPSGNS
jgi:hypothetical protein